MSPHSAAAVVVKNNHRRRRRIQPLPSSKINITVVAAFSRHETCCFHLQGCSNLHTSSPTSFIAVIKIIISCRRRHQNVTVINYCPRFTAINANNDASKLLQLSCCHHLLATRHVASTSSHLQGWHPLTTQAGSHTVLPCLQGCEAR